ncbi:MAG: hypothetical protein HYZ91_00255 [Candidatus Omnitrophica bacterium]|nr:hypothetical protein [Candidatus Omnitrophota bacterium]
MVPWPLALLSLFYGVVATLSASMVWRIVTGTLARPLIWPMMWLALSAGVMLGLPLLKSWGRVLAMAASVLMTATTLAIAAVLAAVGRPGLSLLATVSAGAHVLAIRYLTRPQIKDYFVGAAR